MPWTPGSVPVPRDERFVAVVDGKCESKLSSETNSLKIGNWLAYLPINSAPIPSIRSRHSRAPKFSAIPSSFAAPET